MQVKLVRDKYINIIPKDQIEILTDEQSHQWLVAKIAEETQEIIDSNFNDISEYADVFEILIALAKKNGFTKADILRARNTKLKDKGSFDLNLLWTEV